MRGIRRVNGRQWRMYRPGTQADLTPLDSVSGGQASPPSVMSMPLAQVQVQPYAPGYVTLAYQGLSPLFTADGAAVPATAPGRWAQLFAAGRP